MRAMDFVATIKKIRVKANCKPWFDSEIISAIQKRSKLYPRSKNSGLETDKNKLKPQKYFFKRCYTEIKALTLKTT